MRTLLSFVLLAAPLAACETTPIDPGEPVVLPGPPGPPGPPTPRDLVVRPSAVEPITLPAELRELPVELRADPTLTLAFGDAGRVLVGGAAGLFDLAESGTSTISDQPILGLVEIGTLGFLVATPEGIFVYDGELIPSELDASFLGVPVHGFLPRGDELWFAAASELYRVRAEQLFAVGSMGAQITSLSTFDGGPITVRTASGAWSMLSESSGTWQRRDIRHTSLLEDLEAAMDGRTFGLVAGQLLERIVRPEDDAIVWRRVSLSADVTDPGAVGVSRLVVDPTTGAVWAIGGGRAASIDGTRVRTLELPGVLGAPMFARVGDDGALWISDGTKLARIGSDEPPISFAEQLDSFSERNCERCHSPMLGISSLVLNDLEKWRANIDDIVTQVEASSMPLDGAALIGGNRDLPRLWRAGGMRP